MILMNTREIIPEEALERDAPFCSGHSGRINWRGMSVRQISQILTEVACPAEPEFLPLVTKLKNTAEAMAQRLWHLLAMLEDHERRRDHIVSEIQKAREHMAELPPFDFLEPPPIANARQGAAKLSAELGKELRDENRKWLELCGEEEVAVGEILAEHNDVLSRVGAVTQSVASPPTLRQVLTFMNEPKSEEVFILPRSEP
jgi:hypothetical protein